MASYGRRPDPLRMDTATLEGECLPVGAYGLGLDPETNHVWLTSGSSVMELDEDGVILGSHGHGSGSAQGLAVDGAGNVWVSHTFGTTVGHVRTDGTFVGNVSLLGSGGTTGVAVDVNGKIWSANIGGDTSPH